MGYDATIILNMPYSVTFNSVVLGYTTTDGCKVTVKRKDVEVKADQYGDSPLGLLSGGESATVECHLEQWSVDNFKVALPWGRIFSNGGYKRLTVGRLPGRSIQAYLKTLVLHRYPDASTTTTYDVKFYKAACVGDLDMQNAAKEHFKLPLKFQAFVDTTKADGAILCEFGTGNASTSTSS